MKKLVVVSEKLGNEEDLLIAGDAYIDEKGNIYPKTISEIEVEDDTITIEPIKKQKISENDIIIGVVTDIKKNSAIVNIQKNLTKNINLDLPSQIAVGDMSFSFIGEIRDALRIGDVVKAKVIKASDTIDLTIKERDLGVEMPFCISCRTKLNKKVIFRNKDIATLSCTRCYTKQTRKMVGGF